MDANVSTQIFTRASNWQPDWVRNIGYDTVEAVAEGEREKVERFIEMMKRGPRASRVDESKVEWEDATGEFTQFGVKRSM